MQKKWCSSSHITQPLDVGFYGPLTQAWKKAVVEYSSNNIGKSVTKQTFAKVFKVALENTVKISTIVHSFRSDFCTIRQEKLAPSTIYTAEPASSVQNLVSCTHGDTVSYPLAAVKINIGGKDIITIASALLGWDVPELLDGTSAKAPMR